MIVTDPSLASPRADLPYLRRRTRPAPTTPAAPAATAPVAQFVAGHSTHAARKAPAAPAAPPPRAAPSSSLDLDAPVSAAPPLRAAAPSSSLDLDAPVSAAPVVRSTSASLDLSRPDPTPAPPTRSAPPPPETLPVISADERVLGTQRLVLTNKTPSVTLTRLQSAIGALTFEVAASAEVGDVRLGCAYELTSGVSSILAPSGSSRFGPPKSRRPVLVAGHDRYERISIDLRQCRDVSRVAIYVFSESRQHLNWGGTLIVTTLGGARVELPLESLASSEVAVLMSLYNVAGEFVLRAEMQSIEGSIREACHAYGYDRITWVDDRTPVE